MQLRLISTRLRAGVLWRSLFDVGAWSRFGKNPQKSLLWLLTPILDVSYRGRSSATIARSHNVVLRNLSTLQSGRVEILELSYLHTLQPFSHYYNEESAERLGATFPDTILTRLDTTIK